jgi:3-hydroxybutyryl-CoA dehydratase
VTSLDAPATITVTRLLDQPRVDRYATASGDPNPIHRDTPEARASQFGRPVAHGMLVLALVSEAMAQAFSERWAASGSVKVRWRAPALVPITVTARCTLRRVDDGLALYDVSCEGETREVLLTGTASVRVE